MPSWLHFGSMLLPFWCQVGGILGHLAARAGTGWAGGVTPSFGSPIGLGGFAKRKELKEKEEEEASREDSEQILIRI